MPRSELKLLLVLAAIQFLSFLDFELMMPLGPFIGPSLGVNATQLGDLVSAYTLAAMVGALIYSRFADRYEKRGMLVWLMAGLGLGTLACSVGHSYGQLLAARIVAGLMAGPASTTVFSIVSDVVPEERRGKGIGIVMGGFTVASVLGIPLAVYLADALGWRLPFAGLGALAALVILAARFNLPVVPGHGAAGKPLSALPPLYRQTPALLAWVAIAVLMIADFAFVPFLPTYFTANLGVAKSDLGLVYGGAGLTTLFSFQLAGRLTDRFGSFAVYSISTVLVIAVTAVLFLFAPQPAPLLFAVLSMAGFFLFNAPRIIAAMTLFTKAAAPEQRGEFLSLQNMVQYGTIGLGSLVAAHSIHGEAGAPITGVGNLVAQNWSALLVGLLLIWTLQRAVGSAQSAAVSAPELG